MSNIHLHQITKSFGPTPVLRDVSLVIKDGEFLTLLGPSGCGKSTLLRILAGLEVQDSGSVWIGERPVDGVRPKLRDIAMVFQSYALYPHMTVGANMALPLRMRRLNAWQRLPILGWVVPGTRRVAAEIEAEVSRTAKALDIGHLLSRKPGQLSGGQRQRVAVGRAMVRHPAVFLMDEPLSNLDAKLRVQMRAEIKDLHRRLGVTFVYVTHDQAEAMTLSDRVAVMLEGELIQVAPPQEIYANPDDCRVAEFVGSPKINLLDSVVRERGSVDAVGTRFQLLSDAEPGTALTLGIRPEAFHLSDGGGVNTLTGAVRLIEHMGSDLFVHLDLAGLDHALIVRLTADRAPHIAPGQTLHLSVKPDRVLAFSRDGKRLRAAGPAEMCKVPSLRQFAL
ncbi:glycerol-3-phosphate ABC transporter ATP-binding protein [Bradyrhizobium sacchari]|uniref:Carbohydrate ABC transporter ATP-binding protein (CUT1 family) n=1 Tax=Bradyrhizobium sacchari TaxID=1399419 RepID=A0A560KC80_9BRAD|nr:ABC transporter ATP-binding protein [Bradyrhizobium sacchari]OPY94416.1 glycerol-3-phosphate ABC transporter ATP-binding protein [Bradyrhizobium sacchari]TWB64558.1 carbohydrate ABC transporter ATP-binding protein (CUT1 family) [Bradyrhizobium sacchari]TWB80882.1 carbohydrate ABC transporter ATP-binding protein (CUT1 family) [Bradyrhizobium sacchari]